MPPEYSLAPKLSSNHATIASVEMLFAHLKRILKLGCLRSRGPRGAQDEFTLAAIAQNLRRLAKLAAHPPPIAAVCVGYPDAHRPAASAARASVKGAGSTGVDNERERCALMKTKQRVRAPRGWQPMTSAAHGTRRTLTLLPRTPKKPDVGAHMPENPRNVGFEPLLR